MDTFRRLRRNFSLILDKISVFCLFAFFAVIAGDICAWRGADFREAAIAAFAVVLLTALLGAVYYKLKRRIAVLAVPLILILAKVAATVITGSLAGLFPSFLAVMVFTCFNRNYVYGGVAIIAANAALLALFAVYGRTSAADGFSFAAEYLLFAVVSAALFVRSLSDSYGDARNRRALNILDLIMFTTPNFLILTDEDSRIEYISDSVARLFARCDRSFCAGRPVTDIFENDTIKRVINEIVESEGYVEKTVELELFGEKRWFSFKSMSLPKSRVARLFDFSDVSDIMYEKLKAENALRSKGEFLAGLNSEVGAPINEITGIANRLLQTNLTRAQRGYAEGILRASKSLIEVIDEILDLSKIDEQKASLSERSFNFRAFLSETLQLISLRASGKNLEFTALVSKDVPLVLIADEFRMKQVLSNVLGNAVKFTDSGAVSLEIGCEKTVNGRISLSFGVFGSESEGAEPDGFSHDFDEPEQGQTDAEPGLAGIGTGLSVSRSLVELMGGTLAVESEHGRGASFRFNMLCESGSSEGISTTSLSGACVLVYEPGEYSADALEKMCRDLAVRYAVARNEEQLAAKLASIDYGFTHLLADSSIDAALVNTAKDLRLRITLMKKPTERFDDNTAFDSLPVITKPVLVTEIAETLSDDTAYVRELEEIRLMADSAPFRTTGVSVLVVDDSRVNLTITGSLLGLYGIRVAEALNGYDAISKLSYDSFDMIFMDSAMPELSGMECAKIIRSMGGVYEKLPIIALSSGEDENPADFTASGMNSVISKPIKITSLNEVLLKYLHETKIVN